MKRETYLEIMRVRLGMWPTATDDDLNAKAIELMEADGYTVIRDRLTDHRFRVRVQRKEGRRYVYNEHTTSTSGYPILAAWEKWQAHQEAQA